MSNEMNIVNIAVLGSTKGTVLQYVIDQIESGVLKGINIKFVLSNVEKAGILDKARKHNLKAIYLTGKDKTREEYDIQVSQLLENDNIDLVLLIGYMRLMSDSFVKKWLNKVVNIHPSILPAFAGQMDLNVHQAVIDRGCKLTGASLIFIDENADTGPIISQKCIMVEQDDTAETLKIKVQRLEGEMLVDFLYKWYENKIKVINNKVFIVN
jgi:phosphoribosylglycinamide formyltransferase-1